MKEDVTPLNVSILCLFLSKGFLTSYCEAIEASVGIQTMGFLLLLSLPYRLFLTTLLFNRPSKIVNAAVNISFIC